MVKTKRKMKREEIDKLVQLRRDVDQAKTALEKIRRENISIEI